MKKIFVIILLTLQYLFCGGKWVDVPMYTCKEKNKLKKGIGREFVKGVYTQSGMRFTGNLKCSKSDLLVECE